jgi:hypothetical protein
MREKCGHCEGTGYRDIEEPILSYWQREIALAGLKSGHEGTIRLAFQLAGIKACPECDFIAQHCKCESKPSGALEGSD